MDASVPIPAGYNVLEDEERILDLFFKRFFYAKNVPAAYIQEKERKNNGKKIIYFRISYRGPS
jgi:hypothetical protein